MGGDKPFESFDREKSCEELEKELKEAQELIEAIRSGSVDVVRGGNNDNTLLKLERIELVEERKQLLHKLQESNEHLLAEIKIRKETENELQIALQRANEATLIKDKFVSLVSHDLRTPLSSIFGYLNLALSRNVDILDPESQMVLRKAISTTERMDKLIEELLDIGRIKRGALQLKYSFVNIYLLAVQVLNGLEDVAARKGVTLVNRAPSKMFIYADQTLFAQVLHNLAYNAIKFCSRGDTITLSAIDGDSSIIQVSDNGIGMEPELLDTIFDYDKKSTRVGTDGETGTGLGLPIGKEIVEAHRGALSVKSSPGKGSVFTITLDSVRPRILIVDDEVESQEQTIDILRGIDADVSTTASGAKALEIIDRNPPHLVLLDLYLPGMDGFTVLEKIRSHPVTSTIPVIVLSVTGEMPSREKALRLGANDFVTKANQMDELLPRVSKFIGYRTFDAGHSKPRAMEKDKSKRQILFLEDDETLVEAMKEFFGDNGIMVMSAQDELSALSLYNSHQSSLDAIVVDIRLPNVSGLALAQHNIQSGLLPLVIFTSKADAKLALEFLSYGVKDYLVKPMDFQSLLGVLNNAIHRQDITSGVHGAMELEGNVNSLSIPSRSAEILRALNWINRKIRLSLSEKESRRFINYVSEFLFNAHEHGNLKLTERDKIDLLNEGRFDQEVAAREKKSKAKINIAISVLHSEVALSVSDEGEGFAYNDYVGMTEEEILQRLDWPCGRGIMISTKYFDSIEYSQNGSSVLLIKKTR
ncbi:MAG: response regulator [Nitrospinota bacterium]|nr:response regulator [Nitrospinota bacterium]